jgi:DNA-binding NarL/FixJ family response regulator
MKAAIAIAVSDLMFQPRIEDAVVALGFRPCIATDRASLDAALGTGVKLVIVDIHDRALDPLDAIARARRAGARVLAFGRHTEPAALRAAREAGAAAAVPRSQLVEEMPELIQALAGA